MDSFNIMSVALHGKNRLLLAVWLAPPKHHLPPPKPSARQGQATADHSDDDVADVDDDVGAPP